MANKEKNKPDIDKGDILRGVYEKKYTPNKLPKSLYEETAGVLLDAIKKGYGKIESAVDSDMVSDLVDNIYMFSAAKTFRQVSELEENLTDENGNLIEYGAYLLAAGSVFDRYNDAWLNSEENTAEWAAKSASNWMDYTQSDVENPYILYKAEGGHPCTICAPLNNIIIDMTDIFWEDNATPQHDNCECETEMVTGVESVKNSIKNKLRVSTQAEISAAVAKSQKKKNPLFNYNPGIDRVIFKDKGKNKHPYFDVPTSYREFAKQNFGLPLPN